MEKILEKNYDINGVKEAYHMRDVKETAQANNEEESESD